MGQSATEPMAAVPPSKDQILERLEHWSTEMARFKASRVFGPLTSEMDMRRRQITTSADRWLDEFNEQKGR